jgi:hypothetical protein
MFSVSFLNMCLLYFIIGALAVYIAMMRKDETEPRDEQGNLTDIISY